MNDEDANVAKYLRQRALEMPEADALRLPCGRDGGGVIRYQTWSFSRLDEYCTRLAHGLTLNGLERGMKTLMLVRPGLDLIATAFALFKIGAVPVVIDPGMGRKAMLSCIEQSAPEAMIGVPLAHALSVTFRGSFKSVHKRFITGSWSWWGVSALKKCISKGDAAFSGAKTEPNDMAAILFTSGSTGPAKGVEYRHRQFSAQLQLLRRHFGIREGEVDLTMLPVFSLFTPALGMCSVIPEMNPAKPATVNPRNITDALRQCKVNNVFGSPVLWKIILQEANKEKLVFPHLKRVLMAGAPVPPSLVEAVRLLLPEGEVFTPYGATECLPLAAASGEDIIARRHQHELGGGVLIGRAFPENEFKIIDPEGSCLDTMKGIGELAVRGEVVTEAYHRLPEITNAVKLRDASGRLWHRMGDMAYEDKAGMFWFCGRKSHVIHTATGPVYPIPVETQFNALHFVRRSACVGRGPKGKQEVVLVIETEKGEDLKARLAELWELRNSQTLHQGVTAFYHHPCFPVDIRHNAKIHREQLSLWIQQAQEIS